MEPDPFLYHLLTLLGNITDLSALDVGCGAGRNALFLRQKGLSVTGLDPSRHRLAEAEKAATELELRLDMVQGAAERLPFEDESFDLLVCTHVLES
ncbi:MAG: ubiG, partial [Dehalococcoidia bacterium]|nr:ubiG [Dehalococcoidia bacterium]